MVKFPAVFKAFPGRTFVLLGHSSTLLARLVKPWEHYIPINKNADDLARLARDLVRKPEFSEGMVERAVRKVSEVISPRGMIHACNSCIH